MEYLNYYLFNQIVDNLDGYIKSKFEYENTDILSYIYFKNVPSCYSKKDKYKLVENFNTDKFKDFIIECAINLSKENDFDNLLFLYGLIISYSSSKLLSKYEIDKNLIDNYISKKYEILFDINYFKDNSKKIFNYTEKMDDMVHNPLIRIFDLFLSNNYFSRGYKKCKKYFKKESKNINTIDEINIEIPSINKYIKNIDDFIDYIYNEIKEIIDSVNTYLIERNDKQIRVIFNIDKEKKL